MSEWTKETSLYVHLPWCKTKCPYCDFNSFKSTPSLEENRYIDFLLKDLEEEIEFSPNRVVKSIYFGGGTPSLFSGDSIEKLLDEIRLRVPTNSPSEVTLEVNPESATKEKLRHYRMAGVNRISLGVQSFSDGVLSSLSRPHTAKEAINAYFTVREAGFENVNLDLIFGAPKSTWQSDLADLNLAITLFPEHISRYQLTIEQDTKFSLVPPELPHEDDIYKSFCRGLQLLVENGFRQYEVSAYARPGKTSSHNLHYWNYGDYIGVGAGAHSKVTVDSKIFRSEKVKNPVLYMSNVSGDEKAINRRRVDESDALLEYVINATRLVDGFIISDLHARTCIPPNSIDVVRKLKKAVEKGFLSWNGDLLKPTSLGRLFLNDLQLVFL